MGRAYVPHSGDLFNVIVSLQYRGYKANEFWDLSFSSTKGIERATKVLGLEEDLSRMGFSRLKSLNNIYRSSFGYPHTIEVLFTDCEGGKPSEDEFHLFYELFAKDPRDLEDMMINSIFIYFLPRSFTKLDKTITPKYVLRRPNTGWKFDRYTMRSHTPPTPAPITPRESRRDRSLAPSRSDASHGTITREGPARPSVTPAPVPAPALVPVPTPSPVQASPYYTRRSRTPPRAPMRDRLLVSFQSDASHGASTNAETAQQPPTPVQASPNLPTPSHSPPRAPRRNILSASSQLDVLNGTSTREEPTKRLITPVQSSFNLSGHSDTERDSGHKRIRELELELSVERQRRMRAEACLQVEHSLLEMERRKLEDLRQEQMAAFLTPAILDAFFNIKSTTHDIAKG